MKNVKNLLGVNLCINESTNVNLCVNKWENNSKNEDNDKLLRNNTITTENNKLHKGDEEIN